MTNGLNHKRQKKCFAQSPLFCAHRLEPMGRFAAHKDKYGLSLPGAEGGKKLIVHEVTFLKEVWTEGCWGVKILS